MLYLTSFPLEGPPQHHSLAGEDDDAILPQIAAATGCDVGAFYVAVSTARSGRDAAAVVCPLPAAGAIEAVAIPRADGSVGAVLWRFVARASAGPIVPTLLDLHFVPCRHGWERYPNSRGPFATPGFEANVLSDTTCSLSSGQYRHAIVDSRQLREIVEAEERAARVWYAETPAN